MKFQITIEVVMKPLTNDGFFWSAQAEEIEREWLHQMLLPFFCQQQGVYEQLPLNCIRETAECCLS